MPQRSISGGVGHARAPRAGAHRLFDGAAVLAQGVGLRELEEQGAGFVAGGPAVGRHAGDCNSGRRTAGFVRDAHENVHIRPVFDDKFANWTLHFGQIDPKILPQRQKKGGGMAKAKVLKFDAAGPGLSKTEILKVCEAENVRFMRLQFTDIFGVIKNVELPSSQFGKALDGEIQFDGSSIEGFTRIEESDMNLVPDLNSFAIYPWAHKNGEKVGRLICDVYNPDGSPFAGCPRMTLKKQMDKAVGPRLHARDRPRGRVLPVPPRRQRRPDRRHARRGRLLRPDARRPRRRGAARHRPRPRADGLRGRGRPPRGRRRPARDRLQVRRRRHDRRPRLDLPLHRQEGRDGPRPARHLHAEADLRDQRLGHARPPVLPRQEGQQRLLRRRRPSTSSRRPRCTTRAASCATPAPSSPSPTRS